MLPCRTELDLPTAINRACSYGRRMSNLEPPIDTISAADRIIV
jgi:hypothetical protein